MTDAWDGRPERPEQDGWHWLHHPEDLRPVVQPWSAEHGAWGSGALHSPQGVVDLGFRYLGPALLPAEVADREAAAAEAMREAARNTAASFGDGPFATRRAALAIDALPIPAAIRPSKPRLPPKRRSHRDD